MSTPISPEVVARAETTAANGVSHLIRRGQIVVGVSGKDGGLSEGSVAAVRRGVADAVSSHAPLTIVTAYEWDVMPGSAYGWAVADENLIKQLRAEAEQLVQAGVTAAHETAGDSTVSVTGAVVRGTPAETLERLAADARQIVVGTRHLHWLGRAVLGSVSSHVAANAACPVTVLCAPGDDDGEVVVALSDDDAAAPVLRYAFDFAEKAGRAVRVVFAMPELVGGRIERRDDGERWIAEALAGPKQDHPDVAVQVDLRLTDHAVEALLHASTTAHTLVVGRRADRRMPDLHLGSVSQAVLHHAGCPVVVVPPEPRDA